MYTYIEIKNEALANAAIHAIQMNWQACAKEGKPLCAIVTNDAKKRNAQQNKRYWADLLRQISEQAWANGRLYGPEIWHEWFANCHLPMREMQMPDGTKKLVRTSTTDLTVKEFSDYMQKVEAEAASSMGVIFYAREE